MMDSWEDRFTTNSLLVGVAFEQVHFRFGLEPPDVQFNFINIFLSLSIFPIRPVEKFALYFTFNPRSLYIVESEKNGSRATKKHDNKTRFSAALFSGPIRLTGKFAFELFNFYLNQCRFSGGPPLGGILANPVGLSRLLEAGLN